MAAVSQLSIFNMARVKAGEQVVTDLSESDDTMRAGLAVYEELVLRELENGEWAFAQRQSTPTVNVIDDTRGLAFQYVLPTDCIGLIGVRYRDNPLEGHLFRIEGLAVWCYFGTGVTFLYKFRPPESQWPRRFSDIIASEVCAVFMELTERHSEAAVKRQDAMRERMIARHTDARQRHNRPIGQGSIINRRRGGSVEQWTNLPTCASGAVSNGGVTVLYPNDNDAFVSADYTVQPGIGYVGADCSAGGGVTLTITYPPGDDTLNKHCVFQKLDSTGQPSDLGTMVVADGVGHSEVFNGGAAVEFRRAGGLLKGPF